ncbi:unnamed protein product [Urochloa humidicola]
MEWEDLGDWITWGVLALVFLVMVATALVFLAFLISHALRFCFRRGNNAGKKPPLSIEELLESIPDVAYSYKELPPAAPDDKYSRERDSCAICVTPYEAPARPSAPCPPACTCSTSLASPAGCARTTPAPSAGQPFHRHDDPQRTWCSLQYVFCSWHLVALFFLTG